MASSTSSPYDLLGAKSEENDFGLRAAYRNRIVEFTKDRLKASGDRKISADRFRLVCRAYETLSDYDKRKHYDQTKQWVSNLPLTNYTLQQYAAEPDLASQLKNKLKDATLRDINAQDPKTGHTPLYCAARACNVEAVYYLTEQGAEPDLPTQLGSTSLHVSSFYGHSEMVRCLLESGANYLTQNSFKNLAEAEAFNDDVKGTFAELKQTPFVQAAANQLGWFKTNIDNIENHIDEQYYRLRQTLLHCASKKGFFDLVCWLVEKRSANLDIVDLNLNSALHLAAYGGYKDIVHYLLNRGANSLLINKWGMTAEQEGVAHGKKMTDLFRAMRDRDMFEMAANGIEWWFEYYFADNSPNTVNNEGATLLYIACRHGQTSLAKWLLEKGADVNVQLSGGSRSTSLHGAAYHGHVATVVLLLERGADVNIKNQYGETVFENAKSNEVKDVLEKYRKNLKDDKLLTVHLFGDGKKSGDKPLGIIQLRCDATLGDLLKAMPDSLREYSDFTIARRPLIFDDDTTVLSAVCRARYGKTKFIELPLCITVHERSRYMHSGHVISNEVSNYNSRAFQGKFMSKCKNEEINIRGKFDQIQTFSFGKLTFTFAINCASEDLSIEVQYILSPDFQTFQLPECICLFQTRYYDKNSKLNDMPIVSFNDNSTTRLYNWVQSSPYWFANNTRHIRLPFIGGVHAFVRHVDIIPSALTLPPDMFIQAATNKPFSTRDTPIYCQCLKIREHNVEKFPHIAYHGTNVKVIPSILMDGLVMPSTIVSSGIRVCPPTNHIARGETAFKIADFSNGIFISPSIHYCSDPVYAVTFTAGDQRLIAVLECSVKKGSFEAFPSTVTEYTPHPTDDINAIEWRLTNPAAIEIISILFIPVIKSRIQAARLRADKLGVDPNAVA
jgi:ankyrin repeat protein